ncbi:MAG: HAMP domain-containing histidine kinase [Acholeplasmatales bacterium]|nr:HAMP domain-containing histidine kinase [Acholeplasmatales bacterium]
MSQKRNRSLRFNVAFYFFLLIGILLIVMWLFQAFLITPYYEQRSKNNLKSKGNKYYNAFVLDVTKIEEISRESMLDNIHITIAILEKDITTGKTKLVPILGEQTGRFPIEFDEKKLLDQFRKDKVIYSDTRSDMYIYAKMVDDNSIFIASTRITPISATRMIITEQLIVISIIAIVIGFIFTFVASRSLSNPLEILTSQAAQLSKGNLDIKFIGKGYSEVEKLAITLSEAEKDIKSSDEYRRSITANVTHDLKTPLTIIKSYAEMIMDLYGDNVEKRNEALQIIMDESDRLADLVNDVLMLSKLESGTLKLETKELDLSILLKQCLSRFEVKKNEGYIINTDIDDNMIVEADEKKMNAVFYNLIGNAIKYSGENKTIDVSLKKNNYITTFRVTNYGNPIETDKQEKIWDEYYRDENTHTRSVVGTGLGLSICKNVFELHKLEYGVESDSEKTTFFFKIQLK